MVKFDLIQIQICNQINPHATRTESPQPPQLDHFLTAADDQEPRTKDCAAGDDSPAFGCGRPAAL